MVTAESTSAARAALRPKVFKSLNMSQSLCTKGRKTLYDSYLCNGHAKGCSCLERLPFIGRLAKALLRSLSVRIRQIVAAEWTHLVKYGRIGSVFLWLKRHRELSGR